MNEQQFIDSIRVCFDIPAYSELSDEQNHFNRGAAWVCRCVANHFQETVPNFNRAEFLAKCNVPKELV